MKPSLTCEVLTFKPNLQSMLWGGDTLPRLKGIAVPGTPVGESWEVSAMPGKESVVADGPLEGRNLAELAADYGAELLGEESIRRYGLRFPLLVKFIDARRDLSIQVHPDDSLAGKLHGSNGKTEMWYVLSAEPGSNVILGFRRPIDAERFASIAGTAAILDEVNYYPTQAGASFMVPAGTLHSIGAGNVLAEIQQSSDLTYRVYDYGRTDADGHPRALHIASALRALDYRPCTDLHTHPDRLADGAQRISECQHFNVDRVEIHDGKPLAMAHNPSSFRVVMCVDGEIVLTDHAGRHKVTLPCGFSARVPAANEGLTLSGNATALIASV